MGREGSAAVDSVCVEVALSSLFTSTHTHTQTNPRQVVKGRIGALIDREYLERDPDNTNQYRYLA